MFEILPESKPDQILGLMALYRADTRSDKLDLGVGVYKDEHGQTPIMHAVKEAERQLLAEQNTKSYVAPLGSAEFVDAMRKLVFGPEVDVSRVRGAQAVGGSGALRILADLARRARPEARIWVSDPSWPNHVPLLSAAGFTLQHYPYYDSERGTVPFDAMLEALSQASAGDLVVLHGCCHNPTGADLDSAQWTALSDLLAERQLIPFIDLAYQGFGDGLEHDAEAVRQLSERVPEMLVAASCSKNLGLYRERVGAALIMAADEVTANRTQATLGTVIRSNYSMPPDHGANVACRVLSDPDLCQQWQAELEQMRKRMVQLRQDFADALRKRSNSDRFDFIARQKGMFSRLPLSPEQIEALREQHGIYIVGDGRINVAGLPDKGLDALAERIASVLS